MCKFNIIIFNVYVYMYHIRYSDVQIGNEFDFNKKI